MKLVDLEMKIHHTTERAIKASLDGDPENAVWLPLSVVEVVTERGKTTVTMPQDFAQEKDLV